MSPHVKYRECRVRTAHRSGTQTPKSATLLSEVALYTYTTRSVANEDEVDMAEQSTMPSQDDDSDEVNVNSLHDVMAVMTRRFEQLLI